jgi:hypothetical protein
LELDKQEGFRPPFRWSTGEVGKASSLVGRMVPVTARRLHAEFAERRSFAARAISGSKVYFGCTFGSPPGVPGGGMILR